MTEEEKKDVGIYTVLIMAAEMTIDEVPIELRKTVSLWIREVLKQRIKNKR